MNEYNVKRLENVLEELKHIEEEIVPCWVEEDHTLSLLCEDELFSDEMCVKHDRVVALEDALTFVRDIRSLIRCVIDSNKGTT